MAAADSRHRPRARQLAGPDQVDRRQPRNTPPAQSTARGLARRHATRAAGDRLAHRVAQPFYSSVFTPGAPARAATEPGGVEAAAHQDRRLGDACAGACPFWTGRDRCVDTDQIEQLFINLIRNAADACLEVGGGSVTVPGAARAPAWTSGWMTRDRVVEYGKPVRAVLHHQAGRIRHRPRALPAIAEAHDGSLRLENRADARGARATLTLPL